jgi:sugar lactone lactonase YvrE
MQQVVPIQSSERASVTTTDPRSCRVIASERLQPSERASATLTELSVRHVIASRRSPQASQTAIFHQRAAVATRPLCHAIGLACLLLMAACGSDAMTPQAASGEPTPAAASGTGAPAAAISGGVVAQPTAAAPTGPAQPTAATTASPAQPTAATPASAPPASSATPTPAVQPSTAGASAPTASNTPADPATKAVVYWLDILGNTVYRANADGSQMTALVKGNGISAPDGVVVDLDGGHVYWSNMGNALGGGNLGTVQRAALDGSAVETIVPAGVGNTFKQMTMDRTHHKLYWCDREGAKVWRSDLDGTNHEVLASGHDFNQLVGIALDVERGQFYFSDRNAQKILRASMDMPAGQTDANRSDIETLFSFSGASMPIDLDLDLDQRMIYWTDRGLGTVSRGLLDMPAGQTAAARSDVEVLIKGAGEPIGISLDRKNAALFYGTVAGELNRANMDGSAPKQIAHVSSVTGVTVMYVAVN